jgi:hypothetical protein
MDWNKFLEMLPKEVDKVDDIPEELRYLYDKKDGGAGYTFKGSKPLFTSMTAVKAEKVELSTALETARSEVSRFTALGTYDALKELHDKQDQIKSASITSNEQIEQLRAQSQARMAELENTYKGTIESLKGALGNTVKQNLVDRLVEQANLTEEGKQVVPRLLPTNFAVDMSDPLKPKLMVVDDTGKLRMNAKMDPMQPAEVLSELREKLPSMFRGNGKSGAGAGEGGSAMAPTNKKPSTWTPEQKSAYQREHGHPAYQELVKAEGIALAAQINEKANNSAKGQRAN